MTGLAMALYYRKYGPPSTRKEWEEEEEEPPDGEATDGIAGTEYTGDPDF
jgi:hypothetical protein